MSSNKAPGHECPLCLPSALAAAPVTACTRHRACTQPQTSKALSFSADVTLGGIPYLPLQAADQSYPAWSLNGADRLPLPPPSLTGKKSLEGERLNRGWERISIITHVD